ncbi:ADP-ribosylation factor-related protein [Heterostelium album PN500]|uniref:ADP-ribosylation factor-related protein n=1 Tax=Heterostelium pallidum (strain ATCC 26659 / Pp 5 / PN500) TaxID=670386 RepID=D3B9Z5_HETP5|nr:ADP-ribosylation factor-related protein [Heterostelium album PN500]EFA81382.1 ADP-ribosylation factor-related protein [Heterostelium album PN500]|eukprot:XP_020433500.1 ADP-ribosylation factor-related protein [Heterostelium album PN500]
MGSFFTKKYEFLDPKANHRVIMIGLDGAGKTTLLYRLKIGEIVSTLPTIGFNIETIQYKNINFTVWDVGGQNKIRALWKQYFLNSTALIFVIDSTDYERISEVQEEISNLATDEVTGSPLLIYLNKQDQPNAMNSAQLTEKLRLNDIKDRKWYVQPMSAKNGDGIFEGLDWLSHSLKTRWR